MGSIGSRPSVQKKTTAPLWMFASLILLFFLVLAFYTLLHEGGHALLGLLFGGHVTDFNASFLDLSAHVNLDGQFSMAQHALISLAGVSLPLILCMGFVLIMPASEDTLLEWFKAALFMVSVNPLLAWITIPILAMFGQTVSDDSFGFLGYTHFSPLFVSGTALLIYAACWFLYIRQERGLMSLINRLRNNQLDLAQPATRRTLRTLAAFGVIVLTANLSLTLSSSHNAIVVPSGYQLATEIQLDHRLEDQPIYRFTLNQASTVNFFIELNQVNGAPTQIQLFGPEGHLFTFLQDNDPQAQFTHASCHPAGMQLNPGTYEIRATLQPSPGSVRVYMLIE